MLTYARVYESVGKAHAPIRIMLPPGLGEKVTWADTTAMGVYQILKDCLGVIPTRATFNISTELPDSKLAATLRISPRFPSYRGSLNSD
jgi:GntR family transcriptional regulator